MYYSLKKQRFSPFDPACESESALSHRNKRSHRLAKNGSTKINWNCGKSNCMAKSRRNWPQPKLNMSLERVPGNFLPIVKLPRPRVNLPIRQHRPTTVAVLLRRAASRTNRRSSRIRPPERRLPRKWNNSFDCSVLRITRNVQWNSNSKVLH